MNLRIAGVCVVVTTLMASACIEEPRTVLGRLLDARQSSAEALLQFAKMTEAGNRVVMADTPDAASIAARDLSAAVEAVTRETTALGNELRELSYSEEGRLLEEFQKQFADFRALDRDIVELAEQDTNLKAQHLSFGAAQEAADALRDALGTVIQKSASEDWHVKALTAEVLSSIREIQALEAPHIAESDDAVMSRIEARIGRAQSLAQQNLASLVTLARAESSPAVKDAATAFDRFIAVHNEIVKLSRRNSNVRALALALGKRRALAAACDEHLRTIQEDLSKRDIGPSRSS